MRLRLLLLGLLTSMALAVPPPPWDLRPITNNQDCTVYAYRDPVEGSRLPATTLVFWTGLASKEMKLLARTDGASRILGLAADDQRLYLALWTNSPAPHGNYYLYVFCLKDGSTIGQYRLASPPSQPGPDTLGEGPLEAVANGVTWRKETFTFRGSERTP
ncbi:MAG: hypothetical protein KC910_00455 [Candidatus Eremiobacteraeota bacterium]|nr:hypothetical protein [Candidatus Eremiobacteraeota bacterium]